MWRGAEVFLLLLGHTTLLLTGLNSPWPPPLVMFTQAQNVRAIFCFFSSGNIFVILCLLLPELELLLSLLFSPLTVRNFAILFHKCSQLHKYPSCFPSSQLAFFSSLFEPHCALLYLLWHLTHLTCVTIVSSPLWDCELPEDTYCVDKVLTKCLLNWIPGFFTFCLIFCYINVLYQTQE